MFHVARRIPSNHPLNNFANLQTGWARQFPFCDDSGEKLGNNHHMRSIYLAPRCRALTIMSAVMAVCTPMSMRASTVTWKARRRAVVSIPASILIRRTVVLKNSNTVDKGFLLITPRQLLPPAHHQPSDCYRNYILVFHQRRLTVWALNSLDLFLHTVIPE